MTTPDEPEVHAAWLSPEAFRVLGSGRIAVYGDGDLVDTAVQEVRKACARWGGEATHHSSRPASAGTDSFDTMLALTSWPSLPAPPSLPSLPAPAESVRAEMRRDAVALGDEGFTLARRDGTTVVLAEGGAGLLYGLFHLVRLGRPAFLAGRPLEHHRPAMPLRMVDHWDNVDVHPVMGQVERGYAGGSIFWDDGALRGDLTRVRAYARLLASCGVNAVSVNNVNVHITEAHLLTDRLGDVAALARELRPYAIRTHLSVSFAAPIVLGGLATADPLDPDVRAWWTDAAARVYELIPDFGGFVVKADSEGQPGPFAYGRSHADGANLLADALAPFGGVVHWRAFVYNHRQDWRDRSTDRARAAYDHFSPLDGGFRDNAILQVKHGPMDFQAREPVSPIIAAMPSTRLAVEIQATQEYTGQQKHVCYLGPMWSEVLGFQPWGPAGRTVAEVAQGESTQGGSAQDPTTRGESARGQSAQGESARGESARGQSAQGESTRGESAPGELPGGGLVVVSNAGDDRFWTGHPLAQANLYAAARLAWDPWLDPAAILDEWIDLTFTPSATADPQLLRRTLHAMMDESWRVYERYTAPLGVGFMVRPHYHYGPDVDGYEYTPWGTYHFADRDGVGVDRTRATGTGFTGQYPAPWADVYESLDQCPDELLLFFHHVPYGHVLRCGSTVVQHIYDTHFAGVDEVLETRALWERIEDADLVPPDLYARVRELLDEQVRCAVEWRDQVNAYFFRKSGVPDAHGRRIF